MMFLQRVLSEPPGVSSRLVWHIAATWSLVLVRIHPISPAQCLLYSKQAGCQPLRIIAWCLIAALMHDSSDLKATSHALGAINASSSAWIDDSRSENGGNAKYIDSRHSVAACVVRRYSCHTWRWYAAIIYTGHCVIPFYLYGANFNDMLRINVLRNF